MNCKLHLTFFLFILSFGLAKAQELPRIVKNQNGVKQLIVNNGPFIFLGGELHNSTASSLDYLAPKMENLKERHLNSVIATVSWELFEPQEGKFDYTLVKGIIDQARQNNMKLILIWFGTWKNAGSTYVPEWVKVDLKRFPRMQTKPGKNSGSISAFSENALKADIKAFIHLMAYIKEYDAKEQTVLMMQVENETGILEASRDHCPEAEKAFQQSVPEELLNHLAKNEANLIPEMQNMLKGRNTKNGATWQEVFSYGADEAFSAWHIARYVNEVAKAGKKEYNIPMYVNAWHDWEFSKTLVPTYPSGGPVSKMFDIWMFAAPAIDIYAVDVYHDDFKTLCKQYTQAGNPLFLPELSPSVRQAAYVYYALGQNAMCFSPFAIDGFPSKKASVVAASYKLLSGFLPFFTQRCGQTKNIGLLYSDRPQEEFQMEGYKIRVRYTQKRDEEKDIPESAGLILQVGKDEFFVCGFGINVSFDAMEGEPNNQVEILLHEEGEFKDGTWMPGRRMNGDELGINLGQPSIRRVKFHKYK
jgi:hypothetical protein